MDKKKVFSGLDSYIPVDVFLFLLVYSCLLIIHCIGNTSVIYSGASWLDGMYTVKKVLYLMMLAKIMFFSSYRPKEIIVYCAVLVISFGSYAGSRDVMFFELFLLAIAAKKVPNQLLVGLFFWIKSAFVVMTLFLWKINVLPALYYWNGSGYYNTFGFCHRNVMGANIAIICLAWFYLRYAKLSYADMILWLFVGIEMYSFTHSRSSLIIILLVSVCVYLFRKTDHFWLTFVNARYMILLGFFLLILISLGCMVLYSPRSAFWTMLNKLFTTRLKSANYCYQTYGLSLFGKDIPFVSSMQAQLSQISKLILDNSYVRVVLYYGMIPAAAFFAVYYRVLKETFVSKDGATLISLLLMAIYGLSERYMLDAYYQFPLLIAMGQTLVAREKPAASPAGIDNES